MQKVKHTTYTYISVDNVTFNTEAECLHHEMILLIKDIAELQNDKTSLLARIKKLERLLQENNIVELSR